MSPELKIQQPKPTLHKWKKVVHKTLAIETVRPTPLVEYEPLIALSQDKSMKKHALTPRLEPQGMRPDRPQGAPKHLYD